MAADREANTRAAGDTVEETTELKASPHDEDREGRNPGKEAEIVRRGAERPRSGAEVVAGPKNTTGQEGAGA